MEQDQPGLLERSFGEIHYRWAIAKLTFLIMNAVSLLGVLFTHFFVWPMEFWDGAAIVTGVSTASAIFAFIFKRIPDVDFDF